MTPYHSGIAFEPRPLVAQEADNACRTFTPEQTIQKKLNHEIDPFDCDDAYKEIIDASSGRRLHLPMSIVARYTVPSQDTLPPEQEFAPEQEQPRYRDPARDAARSSLYEKKFIDASPSEHTHLDGLRHLIVDNNEDKNDSQGDIHPPHESVDHEIHTPSPPNKTNLYVNAPIEIEMLGKKRVLRPATVLDIYGIENGKNRVHARLDGPHKTELTVHEDKVILIADSAHPPGARRAQVCHDARPTYTSCDGASQDHSLPNYTDESSDEEDEIPINGRSTFQKTEHVPYDHPNLYELLERTITDLRAKQKYATRNPVLGWKVEYKPRINGVARDGDWYVTSPSKKGYRSLRTLRDALLK